LSRFIRPALLAAAVILLVAPARAADAPQEIVIQNHAFTPSEIHVKAGQPAVLHVRNQDATAEEFDSAALKLEKVIPGHGETMLRTRPLKAGRYTFDGEYHEDTAMGVVIAE
jgi:plastocyanin